MNIFVILLKYICTWTVILFNIIIVTKFTCVLPIYIYIIIDNVYFLTCNYKIINALINCNVLI